MTPVARARSPSEISQWSVSDQSDWVSVKDRLPEPDKEVLVFAKDKIWIASYSVNGWAILMNIKLGNVSHWMELPSTDSIM